MKGIGQVEWRKLAELDAAQQPLPRQRALKATGVLVVPAIGSLDEWERLAAPMQDKLMRETRAGADQKRA